MKPLSDSLKDFKVPEPKGKHDFEFQELCSELEKYWGKRVWTLPHRHGFTENRIRMAARNCWKRGKVGDKWFGYLFKVIQNSKIR